MRQLTGYGARIQPGPPVPHVAVPHSNSIRTRCSTGSTQTSLDPTQTLLRTIPRTVTPLPQHVQRVEKMGHESYVAPHPDLWRQDPVLMSGCVHGSMCTWHTNPIPRTLQPRLFTVATPAFKRACNEPNAGAKRMVRGCGWQCC